MNASTRFLTALVATLLFAGNALASRNVTDPDAPRSLPPEGPVAVSWADPATFSELRQSGNRWEAQRGDWVRQLAEYVRKRAAPQLQPGEQLEVTLTDIRRAGRFEPWHGSRWDSTRIIRDIYPPRIELEFARTDADGRVIAEGARQLTDMAFMMGASPMNSSDPLRYEKRLIDDWLSREFRRPGA